MRTRWLGLWLGVLSVVAACAGDGDAPGTTSTDGDSEACETASTGPRQLRLLTRSEYDATVRDLLGDAVAWGTTAEACQDDAGCSIDSESCVADLCQLDPCAVRTFVYPAGGQTHASVHLAGSFNGWPGTIAAGGWPMTYVPSLDAWVAKHSIADGHHSYKIVIDEQTWITDPNGQGTEDDGFGGLNSTIDMACAGVPDPPVAGAFEPTEDFPVESRPERYPFDNAAESGLVTATHVERYLRAAEAIAERADLGLLTSCDLADAACLRGWLEKLGRRAFRRPLESDHVDKYAELIAAQTSPDVGVQVALRVMLSSPMFLYRQELGTMTSDGTARLDGFEVASALSYFVWGTMPDDALLDAAANGSLDEAAGLEAEVRRLIASDRAKQRLGAFGAQWLGVESVVNAEKNRDMFPDWNDELAAEELAHTRAFIASVVFEGGSYQELLLNDAGILTQSSVLATYAHSDQTSPIRRGVFVRERLLCDPLPPPPPDAATIPEIDPNASTRDRFSQHSSDPACNACHRLIDPVGFAFEHYDAIGDYRETEDGIPIDASGSVDHLDGEDHPLDGVGELSAIIADSEAGPACLATNAYRFALGALETDAEACDLETLAARFAEADYDMRELLVAVTQLESFRTRRAE